MHFEVPKAALSSFREFAGEYLMIVISIMTALALEHTVQSVYHAHLAAETAQMLDAEINANVDTIRAARRYNKEQLNTLGHLRQLLVHDIKAKLPEATIGEHFTAAAEKEKHFDLNVQIPALRHEAWDVAVANQSASWLPAPTLRRYARAYSFQRDVAQTATSNLSTLLNGPAMMNALGDVQLGTVNPREMFHTVNQFIGVLEITDAILGGVETSLANQFGPAPAPAK